MRQTPEESFSRISFTFRMRRWFRITAGHRDGRCDMHAPVSPIEHLAAFRYCSGSSFRLSVHLLYDIHLWPSIQYKSPIYFQPRASTRLKSSRRQACTPTLRADPSLGKCTWMKWLSQDSTKRLISAPTVSVAASVSCVGRQCHECRDLMTWNSNRHLLIELIQFPWKLRENECSVVTLDREISVWS